MAPPLFWRSTCSVCQMEMTWNFFCKASSVVGNWLRALLVCLLSRLMNMSFARMEKVKGFYFPCSPISVRWSSDTIFVSSTFSGGGHCLTPQCLRWWQQRRSSDCHVRWRTVDEPLNIHRLPRIAKKDQRVIFSMQKAAAGDAQVPRMWQMLQESVCPHGAPESPQWAAAL